MELLLIADDLGISPGRDRGILSLAEKGLLSAASLMVNGSSAVDAATAAGRLGLPLGLHLNISEGLPISTRLPQSPIGNDYLQQAGSVNVGGYLRPRGGFPGKERSYELLDQADETVLEWLVGEFEAQVQRFTELVGYVPTRFDSHQHLHLHPQLAAPLAAKARQLGLESTRCPVELLRSQLVQSAPAPFAERTQRDAEAASRHFCAEGISYCRFFFGLRCTTVNFCAVELEAYLEMCEGLAAALPTSERCCEIMCHPGEPEATWDDFNASLDRQRELEFFQSPQFAAFFPRHTLRKHYRSAAASTLGVL